MTSTNSLNFSPHPLIDVEWIRQVAGSSNMSFQECFRLIDTVGPNILFDVNYYRDTYGADIPPGMSCLEHFCIQPKNNPRNPNPLFLTQQWHETIGANLPDPETWQNVLFSTLGAEAKFSRVEWKRQNTRETILANELVGDLPLLGQEICLFVHYDKNNDVQDYVLHYLDALRQQGVCILFLTNSQNLRLEAIKKLQGRVWRVISTDNKAYDWGLYATGVQLLNDMNITGHPILLANDSVVATMSDLSPLFEVARSGRYEITGAVDCWLHNWHIQSFFIYCSAEVVSGYAWEGFWQAYRPLSERWFVVNSHEFGFCRWMCSKGVRMGAAWDYNNIVRKFAVDLGEFPGMPLWWPEFINGNMILNPTMDLWNILLKSGFPFLKKAIFTTPLIAGDLLQICNVLSNANLFGNNGGDGACT